VVDLLPGGSSTLWCSTGPGTPDFNELVVELTTIPSAEVSMAATAPALVTMPLTVLPPALAPVVPASPAPAVPAPPAVLTPPVPAVSTAPAPPPIPAADATDRTEAAPSTAPMPAADTGHGIGRALYELGTAMRERGDHDSARTLLTQAAEAGHRGAARDLGALLLDAGDRAGAEKWWKVAAPDDPRAATSLSELTQRA
jgi:hypothetical protein